MDFQIKSKFQPKGDQPQAIEKLVKGYKKYPNQTLLGVTGSGKTFTMAQVIQNLQKPTLVLAPNKTLAAQLYNEFQSFFPENSVNYFVSYYDYYQPESYIPQTDTYIEKDSKVNERIDQLRLQAAASVLTRKDVIVVASVSCIYGFGRPELFAQSALELKLKQKISPPEAAKLLVKIQFERNDTELKNGRFRIKGDVMDVMQGLSENVYRIEFSGDEIEKLSLYNPISGKKLKEFEKISIFPATPYLIYEDYMKEALKGIEKELRQTLPSLGPIEAHRLKQRTEYDLEMIRELGYCNGIENYSLYFDNRQSGEPPFCLLDFFNYAHKDDWLFFIDESHLSLPQVRAMRAGDRSRKKNLIEHGFRMQSAYDNRPLSFDEFEKYLKHAVFVSATPGDYEFLNGKKVVEQIIRPTGLLDPNIEIHPTENQIDVLKKEIDKVIRRGERVLITTLTKRMSENLAKYLKERGYKTVYLHSEIDTFKRSKIILDLRKRKYDVLVGINLLREGLDIPEVSLVAIMDADSEGFLRNARSLIQTIGRASRNVNSKVIMFADRRTDSIKEAIDETERRRQIQFEYNQKHKIKPQTVFKSLNEEIVTEQEEAEVDLMEEEDMKNKLVELEQKMRLAAENLDFEKAIEYRDKIDKLSKKIM
ncbi:MAG: excinuclease ABC subunit UvrB [Patescibacteria group bacterium]